MKHLDTFSGIGGWALASRMMGWETVAFCERDKFCQKVLRKNFGQEIEIYDDITTFSAKPFRGRIDILTGSTPCQPFSQAGKREGSDDDRHLFSEFLRVVVECQPRWIVIENVFGLLNIESGRVFEEYCSQLESENYAVQTFCIPACALNAPHRRDRLWIVARLREFGTDNGINQNTVGNGRFDNGHQEKSEIRQFGNTFSRNGVGIHNASDTRRKYGQRQTKQGKFTETIGERCAFESERPVGRDAVWFATDSDSRQSDSGIIKESDEAGFVERGSDNRSSGQVTSNSTGEGLEGRTRAGKGWSDGFTGNGCKTDTDTGGEGLQRRELGQALGNGQSFEPTAELYQENGFDGWRENWLDVALRTCVRGVDDEFPTELDESGSRDNRVQRLKALGNAIVPAIAFEIFRAIEQIELSLPSGKASGTDVKGANEQG